MGQVGTGALSSSGSTLPCVGQWYSILTHTGLPAGAPGKARTVASNA
jgi:hypothetical protein